MIDDILRAGRLPRVSAPHPATAALLPHFDYGHLTPGLQAISKPFYDLAVALTREVDGPELTVALRKLLEAKDCAVRAALPR